MISRFAARRHRLSHDVWSLSIMLILLTIGWLGALAPVSAETPASQLRFGVATNRNPLDYENADELGMGWYHNWGARAWNFEAIPGVRFFPTVGAWGDLWGSENATHLQSYIDQCPECYPSGTIWLVSNEMEYDTFSKANGQAIPARPITPAEYAQKYKKYYDMIKGLDPTYLVGVGATYGSFLSNAMQAYEQRYGHKMPIDVYTLHAYMNTGNPDILTQLKSQVNHKRRLMKDYGDQDKWLIVTETGALYDAGAETVTRYMNEAFDYLSTAKSSELGCLIDGNRLVQRWAWFALTSWDPNNDARWKGTDLLDIDSGAITPIGQSFADYPKGPPALPSAYWGSVKLNGSNVPNGTLVEASIDSTCIATATTIIHDGASVYSLDIAEDDLATPEREGGVDGDVVTFTVAGTVVEQTSTWQTGGVTRLDLNLALDPCLVPTKWIADYGVHAGNWSNQNVYPRILGDANGDGRDDIIGFSNLGTLVSLSTGTTFANPKMWIKSFGKSAGGWTSYNTYPRLAGDVNGDGRDDILAFGSKGVIVALSTGTSFAPAKVWVESFGVKAGGWTSQDLYPRTVADVNGDGKQDIVAFGVKATIVALSTGSGFQKPLGWISYYGANAGGWTSQNAYPRMTGDVNGDGRADVVAFGPQGVYVSLSTGSKFQNPAIWLANFGGNQGWTTQDQYPRTVADMNGDGRADIVGFGPNATLVALSTGSGFQAPITWINQFSASTGWTSQNLYPRTAGDVTGEGWVDLVGFGDDGTYVGLANSLSRSLVAGQAGLSEAIVEVDMASIDNEIEANELPEQDESPEQTPPDEPDQLSAPLEQRESGVRGAVR